MHAFVEVTVEQDGELDFKDFREDKPAGVLLDGVGDVATLQRHREVLQGRAKLCWGGRSATMVYAYPFCLAERAVIATLDLAAANQELLETDHWLRDSDNVKVFRLTERAWREPGP